jgi:hypothetical protein
MTRIIRISLLIPGYAIYSYLCIVFPDAQVSLLPWRDVIEAWALCSFWLLLCEYISGSEDERDLFFAGLQLPKKKNGKPNTQNPLVWYRRKWIAIFQFPVIAILVGVVTDITEKLNTYCNASYSPHFAHLWMVILINVSTAAAIMAVLAFYSTLKTKLAPHRPLSKLIAFKGIIGFTFLIKILFAILLGTGAVHPTAQLNYADVSVGIPTLITMLILVPFSVFFHFAYTWKPYVIDANMPYGNSTDPKLSGFKPSYQGGFLGFRAYLYAMNPMETLRGLAFAITLFSKSARERAVQTQYMEPLQENPQHISYNRIGHSGYSSVPSPPIMEPATFSGQMPVNYDYNVRGHSRSPSREQFLSPGGPNGQWQTRHNSSEPESYGPLNERGRY